MLNHHPRTHQKKFRRKDKHSTTGKATARHPGVGGIQIHYRYLFSKTLQLNIQP
jgi:hypothetical protein